MSGYKLWVSRLAATIAMSASFSSYAEPVSPILGMGLPRCEHLKPADFKADASVGQWFLGYYSGALAMNVSSSHGQSKDEVNEKAEKWETADLLESAKALCANHPDMHLYQVANGVVTMVLGD